MPPHPSEHIETTQNWLRRLSTGPTRRTTLLCLPFAGGAAPWFAPLATGLAALGCAADVVAVQYPGRQDRYRERPIDDLHVLAGELHRHWIASAYAGMEVVVFGHSMGAALGFEFVRRLTDSSPGAVRGLIVSGRRAPTCVRPERASDLSDTEFVNFVVGLGGSDARLATDPDLRELVLPALRSDYRAIEDYRVDPAARVAVPVAVYAGRADAETTAAELSAWRHHTDLAVSTRMFDGGHFFVAEQAVEVTEAIAGDIAAMTTRRVPEAPGW